MEEIHWKIV